MLIFNHILDIVCPKKLSKNSMNKFDNIVILRHKRLDFGTKCTESLDLGLAGAEMQTIGENYSALPG